jgi:hypothetical protein
VSSPYHLEPLRHLVSAARLDGVVLAGDSLFALHAGRGAIDPELIHSNVDHAWMHDGEVGWFEQGGDPRGTTPPMRPRYQPETRVVLEDGRAVFR